MKQPHKKHLFTAGAILLILALAAYFRLVNIHDNPGWFTDEGTHLEVARNLLYGRTQYLAIRDSVLLFSRVPLFGHLLAETGRLFGLNITTLRLLTGSLGVITVGLLFLLAIRITRSVWLGLTAAFLLAIFPAAIIYNRFGFSYNLLAPLLLLTCLGLWEYHQSRSRRWLALAALTTGLGTISDLWMISYLPVFTLVVLFTAQPPFGSQFARMRHNLPTLAWSLPLALLPLTLYVVHSLLTVSEAFIFDANFVRARLSLTLSDQLQSLATNMTVLLSQNGWIALGFVGLLAFPKNQHRRFLLLFIWLPLAILGRSTALHNLGFHYFIPFLPFVALGLAALIHRGLPILAEALGPPASSRPLAAAMIAIPLFTTITLLNTQLHTRFQTTIDPFLTNPQDTKAVAAFINNSLHENNTVIANATLTWLLNTNRADFQMSIAAAGLAMDGIATSGAATPHLPANIPSERYAFNPDYRTADMVVIDNWWYTWGQFNVPGLTDMIAEVTTWPLVFSAGDINVYQNPGR